MILSCNGVYLLEVSTEEEAFTEMRKYLEINGISSNSTSVVIKERKPDMGDYVKYKQVGMYYNKTRILTFCIYYQCDKPDNEFTSLNVYCEKLSSSQTVSISPEYSNQQKISWMNTYFSDLSKRKAGGQ